MECKFICYRNCVDGRLELIDTLWNVNTNKEMRQGINTKN